MRCKTSTWGLEGTNQVLIYKGMTEASSSSMDVNLVLPSHLLHDPASLKRGFSLNWNEIRNWYVVSFLSNYCFIPLHLEAAETIKRL